MGEGQGVRVKPACAIYKLAPQCNLQICAATSLAGVEKVIYGAYLYEKQAVLPLYIGSVFCFSTPSMNRFLTCALNRDNLMNEGDTLALLVLSGGFFHVDDRRSVNLQFFV